MYTDATRHFQHVVSYGDSSCVTLVILLLLLQGNEAVLMTWLKVQRWEGIASVHTCLPPSDKWYRDDSRIVTVPQERSLSCEFLSISWSDSNSSSISTELPSHDLRMGPWSSYDKYSPNKSAARGPWVKIMSSNHLFKDQKWTFMLGIRGYKG